MKFFRSVGLRPEGARSFCRLANAVGSSRSLRTPASQRVARAVKESYEYKRLNLVYVSCAIA